MVVKKKTSKVQAVVLDEDKLQQLMACLSVEEGNDGVIQLARTLRSCLELTDSVQQIQFFKKVATQLEALPEENPCSVLDACLNTLVLVFTSLQAKNPLRRAVSRTLGSIPEWLHDRTRTCLSTCLCEWMRNSSSEENPHVVDTISACLDGFPLGERCVRQQLLEVLLFLYKVLDEYLHQNRGLAGRHIAQAQLMQSCLAAVKTSILVLQRSQDLLIGALQADQDHRKPEDTLGGLLSCYIHILTDEDFIQSVQSTAGMAVVLLIRTVLVSGDQVASVVCSLLRGSDQGLDSAPDWLRHTCASLWSRRHPPGVSLYLCHGALAILNWKGALAGPQWEELLLLVPETLLDLDVSVKESSTAMVVARGLTLWSSAALDCLQEETLLCPPSLQMSVGGDSELQKRLLEHIYSHWEHPLDGVRHQTCSLFRNLLLLHQRTIRDPGEDPYITELTSSLLSLQWQLRGKYGSLGCLVELYGARFLLNVQPQLPSDLLSLMGDQTLAPYASDLLEKLFLSHKEQLEASSVSSENWLEPWHQTWVTPLLNVLCLTKPDQNTYILDYVLPKLLRCSPSSLSYMMQVLQDPPLCRAGPSGSRGPQGALILCLRAARTQGVVMLTDRGQWGGLVPVSLLQQALIHKQDQVRMDALGLVCESHRSTEVLTSQEMDLIRHFLPANLNSQSAGVRQQSIGLMKKLLCRVRDSTQLLQKRLLQDQRDQDQRDKDQRDQDQQTLHRYREFLRWLVEELLEELLPGAPFSKLLVTLNLLNLLAQTFTFSAEPDVFALGEMVTPAHAQNILYCMASNFLEVKQLASSLLQQLPASVVGLQDPDTMYRVLQTALDLSTSTKPFDSVTAAHLLNLLLHQSELIQVLLLCAQDQCLDLQVSLPPAQASEAVVSEFNTLAVVWFLLLCLQSEVSQAESSLLQAAASCPLYGRTHCITAVLQNLNPESLIQMDQWRFLVSELIFICYRISAVVSPVVQSTSPEGLIPMDADSDISSSLQKILQEIQPRDTNNFFSSVIELNTHQGGDRSPIQTPQPAPISIGSEAYRVTAQMVLVCCWRSMKEVSMLLAQLVQYLPVVQTTTTQTGLITEDQVEEVGQYFRQQLLQSRHRGAFELAYVGFVRLTDTLCRSKSRTLQLLPALWLSEVLDEVRSSDPSSKLCATRRSAGIPFYIQALLSSEPKSSSCNLLKKTMKELTVLALPSADRTTDSCSVPQVHALNILRALYRDARLGENIVPFVADGMKAAVLGFSSPVWAVRNSSTLLFSTLITRIFGVKRGKDEHSKKNRMTGREFFTRFPALYPFLLKQLKEAATSVESDSGHVKLYPSLFLLLLVLSRLYPSPMDGSSSPLGLAPFVPLIIRCGSSAVYRTREMAARALVPFVLLTHVPTVVLSLLQGLPPEPGATVQQNHIHGTLLQVLFLLRSFQTDSHIALPAGSGIGEALSRCMWLASRQNQCMVTRGACLDVLVCLCGSNISLLEDAEVSSLRQKALLVLMASELLTSDLPAVSGPGSTQYLLSLAQMALSASVQIPELWQSSQLADQVLENLLRCPHYEVRDVALGSLLMRLKEEDPKKNLQWLEQSIMSHLLHLALHEERPQCLTKVLQVVCEISADRELQWRDDLRILTQKEVLQHLLAVVQNSAYSVELHSAALKLLSQMMVDLVTSEAQAADEMACLPQWVEILCSCCAEEQPVQVKLMAAEVLVSCTPTLLTSPHLPLGLSATVSLWRTLFSLLQDEDQDVRDSASDFICNVPDHLLCTDVSMCPPAALKFGVALLCRLFELWGQQAAGFLALMPWLLGDEDASEVDEAAGVCSSDEEDFLFEKGDLNLWAEPLQWVNLLHQHLSHLKIDPNLETGTMVPDQVHLIRTKAQTKALRSQQALDRLPALPQFSCTMEYARLTLQNHRARLVLDVLQKLS